MSLWLIGLGINPGSVITVTIRTLLLEAEIASIYQAMLGVLGEAWADQRFPTEVVASCQRHCSHRGRLTMMVSKQNFAPGVVRLVIYDQSTLRKNSC